GLELHPRAPPVAETTPGELGTDLLARHLDPGDDALDDRHEGLAMRFPGGGPLHHGVDHPTRGISRAHQARSVRVAAPSASAAAVSSLGAGRPAVLHDCPKAWWSSLTSPPLTGTPGAGAAAPEGVRRGSYRTASRRRAPAMSPRRSRPPGSGTVFTVTSA